MYNKDYFMKNIVKGYNFKYLLLLLFLFITLMSSAKVFLMKSEPFPPRIVGYENKKENKQQDIAVPSKDNLPIGKFFNGFDDVYHKIYVQHHKTGLLTYGINVFENSFFKNIQINYDNLYLERLDGPQSKLTLNYGITKPDSYSHLNFLVDATKLVPGRWHVSIGVSGKEKTRWNPITRYESINFEITVVECPTISTTNTPVCNADKIETQVTATLINSPNSGLFNYFWYDTNPMGESEKDFIKSNTDHSKPSFTYIGQGIPLNSSTNTKMIKLRMSNKYSFSCNMKDFYIDIKPLPPDPQVEPFPGCGFTTFKKNKSSDKNDYYYGISPEVAKLGVNKLPDDAFGLKYTEEKDIYFMSKSPNGCWNQIELRFPKDELGTKPSKPVVANLTPCQCELNAATFVGTVPYGATTLSWSGLADQMDQEGSTYAVPRELGVYTVRSVLKHPSNSQADCYSDPLTIYVDPIPCINCTSDFSPIPGVTYVLSAWVKEISDKRTPLAYSFPYIDITYENTSVTSGPFFAKGPIIEGWQKIEAEVEIPSGASMFYLHLKSLPSKNDFPVSVYFDDIRIHPLKANMTSYVYDPITLKLVAELDANNFATFYSHDAEGNLISVKKETIDGIKTIKEGKKVPFRKNEENIRESTEPISITEPNSLYE